MESAPVFIPEWFMAGELSDPMGGQKEWVGGRGAGWGEWLHDRSMVGDSGIKCRGAVRSL